MQSKFLRIIELDYESIDPSIEIVTFNLIGDIISNENFWRILYIYTSREARIYITIKIQVGASKAYTEVSPIHRQSRRTDDHTEYANTLKLLI